MEKLLGFDGTLYDVIKKELMIEKLNRLFSIDVSYDTNHDDEVAQVISEDEFATIK